MLLSIDWTGLDWTLIDSRIGLPVFLTSTKTTGKLLRIYTEEKWIVTKPQGYHLG